MCACWEAAVHVPLSVTGTGESSIVGVQPQRHLSMKRYAFNLQETFLVILNFLAPGNIYFFIYAKLNCKVSLIALTFWGRCEGLFDNFVNYGEFYRKESIH